MELAQHFVVMDLSKGLNNVMMEIQSVMMDAHQVAKFKVVM